MPASIELARRALPALGVALLVSCEPDVTLDATHGDPVSIIADAVPPAAFQAVARSVLTEIRRGGGYTGPLRVAGEAHGGRCVPGTVPCEWVTEKLPLPDRIRAALSEDEQAIRVVSVQQVPCPDRVLIGFTGARVLAPDSYAVSIDLLDTHPASFSLEAERMYTVVCNPRYCEVRLIRPGDEPQMSIDYAGPEVCDGER